MERIGREVERTLSRSGGGEALALAEITAAWPKAVGDAVARQAWPLRVGRDGTLHVATSSATWAFELDRLSPEIAERLAAVLGSPPPAKLRFRVGPVPEPGPEPGAGSQEPSTSLPASPVRALTSTTSVWRRMDGSYAATAPKGNSGSASSRLYSLRG